VTYFDEENPFHQPLEGPEPDGDPYDAIPFGDAQRFEDNLVASETAAEAELAAQEVDAEYVKSGGKMTSITYYFPNTDPEYFQDLVEYVCETDAERNVPETFGDFIQDFVMWMRNK